MNNRATRFLICAMAFGLSAAAQTNTFPANGSVGIGTTQPAATFQISGGSSFSQMFFGTGAGATDLNGILKYMQGNGSGTGRIWIGHWGDNDGAGVGFNVVKGGYVGIGTTNPYAPIDVRNTAVSKATATPGGLATFYSNDASNPFGLTVSFIGAPNIVNRILSLQTQDAYLANAGNLALQAYGGYVGIGTTAPAAKLDVNGSINISGAGAGITFPNGGGTQSVAWTGVLCGGDYAEDMRASGGKATYEPGDVLVLASEDNSDIRKSAEPYSAMVAGIFATKPGVIGRRDAVAKSTDNIPMAMVGVVPTKVSSKNGPIRKGDLLVTSSSPGYAMRGTDRNRMLGAVIGKAMGTLSTGSGVIDVLVTLQ